MVQYKSKYSAKMGQKLMKIGVKINLDLSQFFAILRPFKGYQTAFLVCKMVKGVPMIPRNNPDNILVQYTSKY